MVSKNSNYDLIIFNGTIITINADFDIIENGIVCIRDNKIADIVRKTDNSPLPPATKIIDANSGLIMPGLVNTHSHLPMTLFRGLADDLPLMTWLQDYIFPAEAKHVNPEFVRIGTLLGCAEMLLSGTTTCCDGYFFEDIAAEAVQESGLRGILGQGIIDFPAPGVPDKSLNISVAEKFATKWKDKTSMIRPSFFCHSPYTCSAETLKNAKRLADELQILFQIHVAETKAECAQIQNLHNTTPISYLDKLGILNESTLLAHAIWVNDSDIAIIRDQGASVSITTESEMKLASGIAPLTEYLKHGIKVGLGTDGAASNNDTDMFKEMDFTAKIHKVNKHDSTAVSAKTVLYLATLGGAIAIGSGELIGSIEVGKMADIITIDTKRVHLTPLYHPESLLVYSACGADVNDVVINGKVIVENRKILSFDVDAVITNANKMASSML